MLTKQPVGAVIGLVLCSLPTAAQQTAPTYPNSPLLRPQRMPANNTPAASSNAPSLDRSYNLATIGTRPNPYSSLGMTNDPYRSNYPTRPAIMPYNPPAVSGGVPLLGGWGGGFIPNSMGYGFGLMGIADYTRASGQYWNDIQSARMSREQTRQEELVTQRKRVEWEMEYEKLRPTAAKMRAQAQIDDLNWARNDPPNTEIWSGTTFNVLLQSILRAPNPLAGPNIALSQQILRGLNLRDKSARGNLSLTKDQGKIEWPDALLEKPFDETRNGFTSRYEQAMKSLQYGQVPERSLILEMRADVKAMDDKLVAMVGDFSPMQFIEARRILRELNETMVAMSNPRTVRAAAQDWRKNIRNVADLVNYCMQNGLEFGPAMSPNDFASYTAAYFPLRSYERALHSEAVK